MRFLKSLLFAASLFAVAGPAQADFIFQTGNHPGINEQNILFGSKFTNVPLLVGFTNQTHTPITFDLVPGAPLLGQLDIGTNGVGQADIVCNIGCGTFAGGGANGNQLEDLEIKLAPGFGATDFIGNLDFGEGTFDINIIDQFGASFDFTLGNGQNFFTINAINGEVIRDIQISGEQLDGNGHIGWNDFKQPRISGICTLVGTTCTTIPVPEPPSFALFGAGLIALGWYYCRRQTRSLA